MKTRTAVVAAVAMSLGMAVSPMALACNHHQHQHHHHCHMGGLPSGWSWGTTTVVNNVTAIAVAVAGTNGTNGTNGLNGTNGTNGLNGTNGTNGLDGTNGTNGLDGLNGKTGATGKTGKAGPDAAIKYTDGLNGKTSSTPTKTAMAGTWTTGPVTITNVAGGAIATGSHQAVNGSQIYHVEKAGIALIKSTASKTLTSANKYTDGQVNNAVVTSKEFTMKVGELTLMGANSYTNNAVSAAEKAGVKYTNTVAGSTLASANSYTDNSVSAAEKAGVKYVNKVASKTLNSANSYTDKVAGQTLNKSEHYTNGSITSLKNQYSKSITTGVLNAPVVNSTTINNKGEIYTNSLVVRGRTVTNGITNTGNISTSTITAHSGNIGGMTMNNGQISNVKDSSIGTNAANVSEVNKAQSNSETFATGAVNHLAASDAQSFTTKQLSAQNATIGNLKVKGNQSVGGNLTVGGSVTSNGANMDNHVIQNVAAGNAPGDAANVGQVEQGDAQTLQAANSYTNQQVRRGNAFAANIAQNDANNAQQAAQNYAASGIAAALAMPASPILCPGDAAVGVETGGYDGYQALGAKFTYQVSRHFSVNAGVSSGFGRYGHVAWNAGGTYVFGANNG